LALFALAGSHLRLRYGLCTYDTNSREVFFVDDDAILGIGGVGITPIYRSRNSDCQIVEADIVFREHPNKPWQVSRLTDTSWGYNGDYSNTSRELTPTALHEVGHFFGLGHENRTYNMMGADYSHVYPYVDSITSASKEQGYIGTDMAQGLVNLYGLSNDLSKQDLSVTHFWKPAMGTGSVTGQYSNHERIPLFQPGTPAPVQVADCTSQYVQSGSTSCHFNDPFLSLRDGEHTFGVKRGQQVVLKFGFENAGVSTQTVKVNYYLSTDKSISSADTLLSSQTKTIARNVVAATPQPAIIPPASQIGYVPTGFIAGPNYEDATVVIPSTAPLGRAYLGVMVDAANTVIEKNENNNTSYVAVKITN
jgi:hypothetical protein